MMTTALLPNEAQSGYDNMSCLGGNSFQACAHQPGWEKPRTANPRKERGWFLAPCHPSHNPVAEAARQVRQRPYDLGLQGNAITGFGPAGLGGLDHYPGDDLG